MQHTRLPCLLIVALTCGGPVAQNVGIGTATPTEPLEVAGKTKTTQLQVTAGAVAGYVLTADAFGNAVWQVSAGGGGGLPAGSANDTLRCTGGSTWVANDDLVVTATGHVGIGDPTPHSSYDLTVGNSGLRSEGLANLMTGRLGVGITSTPSSSFDLDIGTSGLRSTGADNVITGQLAVSRTSDPSYDLHVDGNARFDNIGVNTNPSSSYKLYVSGTVRFSSLSTGSGTPLIITGSGDVRKESSSRRYKEHIRDLLVDTDALLALRPVRFDWRAEQGGGEDFGLIAEEVAELVPDLVWREPAGDDCTDPSSTDGEGVVGGVHYRKIGVLLLQVVAEQERELRALHDRVATLEADLASQAGLAERLAKLERLLNEQEPDRDGR